MNINEPGVLQLAQALAAVMGGADKPSAAAITPSRYVTIKLASSMTGLTEKAIRRKVEDGVWVENKEWRRAPDGHIMVDMEGVQKWVEKAAA